MLNDPKICGTHLKRREVVMILMSIRLAINSRHGMVSLLIPCNLLLSQLLN